MAIAPTSPQRLCVCSLGEIGLFSDRSLAAPCSMHGPGFDVPAAESVIGVVGLRDARTVDRLDKAIPGVVHERVDSFVGRHAAVGFESE